MHIRQLLVASVILFATAQMEAGKNGKKRNQENKSKKLKSPSWAQYRKLNKAKNKRALDPQETNDFNFLRNSLDDNQKTLEQPERNYGTDLTNYGIDMDGQKIANYK